MPLNLHGYASQEWKWVANETAPSNLNCETNFAPEPAPEVVRKDCDKDKADQADQVAYDSLQTHSH
jgi:hypothetical protein